MCSQLEVPEPLMKEAYIMRPELSPMVGSGPRATFASEGWLRPEGSKVGLILLQENNGNILEGKPGWRDRENG